jgi:hypothetical protein
MADHLPLALRIGESIADLISIGKIEASPGQAPRPLWSWYVVGVASRPCGSFDDLIRPRQQ